MQKNKMLRLTEILSQESDSEHPITTKELIDKLTVSEITCDRRTLARDISQLQEMGYPIVCIRVKHSNAFYMEQHDFSIAELKILIDTVQAYSVIPEEMANSLIEKIANLGGTHCAELLKQNRIRFNIRKQTNNSVLDSIAIIEESFKRQTQVFLLLFQA
ncbi:MAG: HTH domain-containing protein [Ruminococcus flavefaciens]|nr:HTH domain-containing protein [Ruminococcus flavefaciens]